MVVSGRGVAFGAVYQEAAVAETAAVQWREVARDPGVRSATLVELRPGETIVAPVPDLTESIRRAASAEAKLADALSAMAEVDADSDETIVQAIREEEREP